MVTRISEMFPAPALPAPGAEVREQTLSLWKAALEAEPDGRLRAFVLHNIALLHEGRDDLAAAAREELAATKEAHRFVEPVESLIGISARSRSPANLKKLLLRLGQLCTTDAERVRVALHLAALLVENGQLDEARLQVDAVLNVEPAHASAWLMLETIALRKGDREQLAHALAGRARHCESRSLRGLLFERAARTQAEAGRFEAAFDTLQCGFEDVPSLRLVRAWELIALAGGDWRQACEAAWRGAGLARESFEEEASPPERASPSRVTEPDEAVAMQFRASCYALLAGDDSRAHEASHRLKELAQDSPWAAQHHLALCLHTEDFASAGALLRTWRQRVSPEEQPALTAAAWWVAKRAHDDSAASEAADFFLAAQKDWSSLLLQLHAARTEVETSAESLRGLWDGILARSPSSEIRATRIAHTLFLWLRSSDAGPASKQFRALRLEAAGGADSHDVASGQLAHEETLFATALELVASRLCDDPDSERAALLALHEASSELERRALGWEALRLACSERVETGRLSGSGDGAAEETERWWLAFKESWTLDAWSELLLGALSLDAMSARKVLAVAEEVRAQGTCLGPEALRMVTLLTHYWAQQDQSPWEEWWPQLEALNENEAWEPLGLGMKLGRVTSEERALALGQAAALLDDPMVARAFRLEAAFEQVRRGALDDARQRFEREAAEADSTPGAHSAANAHSTSEAEFSIEAASWETLLRWVGYALARGEPSRLLGQLEKQPDPERHLDHFLLRYHQDRAFQAKVIEGDQTSTLVRSQSNEPQACLIEGLIRTLAADSLDAFERASAMQQGRSTTTPLSPTTIAALRFSLASTTEERLTEATNWLGTAESHSKEKACEAALLGAWTATVELGLPEQEDAAAWQLAKRLGGADWASLVDPAQLEPEDNEQLRDALEDMLENPPDQDARELLAWTRFVQPPKRPPNTPDWDFVALARGLSGTDRWDLEQPDVQLSLLLAAYEAAQSGDDALALELFEQLSSALPSDVAVMTGLRIVAERMGRDDLHARSLSELARHAEDNRQAADLWERAGVLFQDKLAQDSTAEECFEAALGRRPGSALAFERVYRLARKRGDRPRLVELIDARLDAVHSETLRIELLWEKARYCRLLGRAEVAVSALEELLRLAPDHLAALALSAELALLEERWDGAAERLRQVALHPETPMAERRRACLRASDLFHQLDLPRAAVELLDQMESFGIDTDAFRERRARGLAKAGDWGAAFSAFRQLNDEQDEIEQRLESARMMLLIVRDQLKDQSALKDAARRVLRDAPLDDDAVDVALRSEYNDAERARLLAPARERCRKALQKNPLDPETIERFAALCNRCGDDGLERASLGLLALLGQLSEKQLERLDLLQARCPNRPSAALSGPDLEKLAGPALLGVWGRVLRLLEPHASRELAPSLPARGVSPLMRIDATSVDPKREESVGWAEAFGIHDLDFYFGGQDAEGLVMQTVERATLIVGAHVEFPLRRIDRARLAAQLGAALWSGPLFINLDEATASRWLQAARQLNLVESAEQSPDLAELVRHMGQLLPRPVRDQLFELQKDLSQSGISETEVLLDCRKSALRTAVLAAGDPSIVRELPEFLPLGEELRADLLSDSIRFALSETFFSMRKTLGLEGA